MAAAVQRARTVEPIPARQLRRLSIGCLRPSSPAEGRTAAPAYSGSAQLSRRAQSRQAVCAEAAATRRYRPMRSASGKGYWRNAERTLQGGHAPVYGISTLRHSQTHVSLPQECRLYAAASKDHAEPRTLILPCVSAPGAWRGLSQPETGVLDCDTRWSGAHFGARRV